MRLAGGLTIDAATDINYFHDSDIPADGPESLPMLCTSLRLFEHVAQERVAVSDSITIWSETVYHRPARRRKRG
jgi:hypothetical protein